MRVEISSIPALPIRKAESLQRQAETRFAPRLKRSVATLEEEGGIGSPSPPVGGPLALHRAADACVVGAVPQAAEIVDRMIVGKTRDGLPEVRLDVAVGALRGTEVRIAAGHGGLEATFVAATESARRVVEAQLADLARALEARGLQVARCEVTTRESPRRHRDEREPRRSWEDIVE